MSDDSVLSNIGSAIFSFLKMYLMVGFVLVVMFFGFVFYLTRLSPGPTTSSSSADPAPATFYSR